MVEGLSFVVAVIMNDRNELLLLRRSETARRDPGKWGLSGGRLEAGEKPLPGMPRELDEDLGAEMELRLEASLDPLPAIGAKGGSVHLFLFTRVSGIPKLNHEHTAYLWMDEATFTASMYDLDLMPGVQEDLTYFGIWPDRFPASRRMDPD